jgi:hypothetical protein
MSRIKKKEEDIMVTPKFPEYTKQELYAFKAELEVYRINKTIASGPVSYIDFDRYLKDKKALSESGAVYINHCVGAVPIYEVLNDKWNQLTKLQSKVEYAQMMELESLDKTIA